MNSVIALNATFSFGVAALAVAPLIWAILTQHRDLPPVTPVGARALPRARARDLSWQERQASPSVAPQQVTRRVPARL